MAWTSLEDLKLPPHNTEAEKWTLSGVFLDNELLFVYNGVGLKPEDFYQKEHQHIYQAITTLKDNEKTIDVITVCDELSKRDVLEAIGGQDYVAEVSAFALSTSTCAEYAQIVKEKSVLRNILSTCHHIAWDVHSQKETIEILESIEKRIFDLTQEKVWSTLQHIKDVLDGRVEEYVEVMENPWILEERKVSSGYEGLDDLLSGFKQGELLILAARPSMGKTALALNFLINVGLTHKKSVAFFSLEMTSQNLVDRILSTVGNIPMHKITKGQLESQDFSEMGDAISQLGEANIFLDDKGVLTIPELKSKLRRLRIEQGQIDLVIIDYLQLMSGAGGKYDGNRVQEISQISRGLKEIAKEISVPILALSQLSRNVESRIEKKPQLSDLRESGAIEQDADAVLMLYREDYYDPDTDKKWVTEILVKKNRNWPTWEVGLMFHAPTMKFDPYNEWWSQQQPPSSKTPPKSKKPSQKTSDVLDEEEDLF